MTNGFSTAKKSKPDTKPSATTIRFDVKIDHHEFAYFTGVSGLNANYEVFEYAEGGQNGHTHQLPGRLKYTPVVLTRPVDKDSGELAHWFSTVKPWQDRTTARITAYDANSGGEKVIATWVLRGVWPIRYTGPVFSTTANLRGAMAFETIELAHNGFEMTTS